MHKAEAEGPSVDLSVLLLLTGTYTVQCHCAYSQSPVPFNIGSGRKPSKLTSKAQALKLPFYPWSMVLTCRKCYPTLLSRWILSLLHKLEAFLTGSESLAPLGNARRVPSALPPLPLHVGSPCSLNPPACIPPDPYTSDLWKWTKPLCWQGRPQHGCVQ